MGNLKIRQISNNKCNVCDGTGRQLDFKCPLCGSAWYGSSSVRESSNFKRYCHGASHCQFSWMEYEDMRFFRPGDQKCIACNGAGKESVWEDL